MIFKEVIMLGMALQSSRLSRICTEFVLKKVVKLQVEELEMPSIDERMRIKSHMKFLHIRPSTKFIKSKVG